MKVIAYRETLAYLNKIDHSSLAFCICLDSVHHDAYQIQHTNMSIAATAISKYFIDQEDKKKYDIYVDDEGAIQFIYR